MNYTQATRNEYQAVAEDGTVIIAAAPDLLGVAKTLDSSTNPLVLVKLLRTVTVLESEGTVAFTAVAALADGTPVPSCAAYPASFTVDAGDSIILSAVAGSGYTFVEWDRNGTKLSSDAVAQVTVSPLSDTESSAVYTAVFSSNA